MGTPLAKGGTHVTRMVVARGRPASGSSLDGVLPRIGTACVVMHGSVAHASVWLPLWPTLLCASTCSVKLRPSGRPLSAAAVKLAAATLME